MKFLKKKKKRRQFCLIVDVLGKKTYIFAYSEKGTSRKTETTDARERKCWRASVVKGCG